MTAGLGHLAAMAGMTEREFVERMSRLLSDGRLMELLRVERQAALYDWLEGKETTGEPFAVMFRLSANRRADVALYCRCRVDMGGDEPLILVEDSFPSVEGYDKGIGEPFVVELRDLETRW